ncbi:MAG: ATP-dependent helicase [Gallionella sp.]|nr:ATP-dependent helicase [Gallionella sp.]
MTVNSTEQHAIINAPLTPMSVVACAGSGKTRTAVRRLAKIRQQLGDHRGRVALLSFSNVAVDTFTQGYQKLVQDMSLGVVASRVEIDTLDGFITRNVLHPHAHRTMGAKQAPYLVIGSEAFLSGFSFWPGKFPVSINQMQVAINDNAALEFCYSHNDQVVPLDPVEAEKLVQRLGRTGAYTHNLGRYWCYRTLQDQPNILRALVRRYPYILIDEAQDIGTMHQAIIEQLIAAGAQVSLIGDPNQGIYEFAGADGKFLAEYGKRPNVSSYGLTRNYRSAPVILDLANRISARADVADRGTPLTAHGTFFVPYKTADREKLLESFQAAVIAAGLKVEDSAVLCRGRELANKLAGKAAPVGQGLVQRFALAALYRDKQQDYLGAFKLVAGCITSLLAAPPHALVTQMIQSGRYPETRPLCRLIWSFTRDANLGLPSSGLLADTQWHPHLLARVKALLATIEKEHGLKSADNVGNKLAKKGLPNTPLMAADDLGANQTVRLRIDTVHQVKGESLDAVLYIATKEHVSALLAGVGTEVGRIGYVAITRARNLMWLGVPANALKELQPALTANGFKEIG